MDGTRYAAQPGDVLWTGVGCVHAFANIGTRAGAVARDIFAPAAEGKRVPVHGGVGARSQRAGGIGHDATRPATRPFTGAEYLESLRDGREIWIYGERVKDVTTHPAFRNTVADDCAAV